MKDCLFYLYNIYIDSMIIKLTDKHNCFGAYADE